MHDLKALRDDPGAYDANWARRGLTPRTPALLALDEKRRATQTRLQELQSRRNEASKEIGRIKAAKGDAGALMAEVAGLKDEMTALEAQESETAAALEDALSSLPNLLDDDTPDGPDETHNVEVRRVGDPPRLNTPRDHAVIGEALGVMDFETAAKISGARFTLLRGPLARLERALAQFMLDTHTTEHGYTEVSPPLMVKDAAAYGTGQLPKFAEDLFRTTNGYWLVPTAEVPLTNTVADMILDAESLPIRLTAHTPCFRSEAGAAGKDTRGMIRQHQFYKVEMVSITRPEDSPAEHERMTACAENILKKLGLSFRTVALCAGDTGFGARKTYDIEVWLPGQNTYREISSCSNCGDFQARRMKARCRLKGEKDTRFVHTLNGSGLAVGRTLIAVMENYYDPADGGIVVPDVLRPYMGGIEKIVK
ncbi:MAG TPA: serine--tRNA ligase [Alphaproteobacteria bacterium]|nr:serine--tRNA ligase [Alphaproteobacteria bacterium]